MAGYLGLPREQIAVAAARDPLRRARARAAGAPGGPALHDRLPRPHRPGEGPAPAGRGLHPAAPRAGARRPSRLEVAGYLAPEHRTYLDGVGEGARRGRARRRVPLPRDDRPAAQDRVPAGPRRALGPEPVRRAEGALPARGAGHAACRSSSRGTAPSPRSSSRPAAALLFAPGDVRGLADAAARARSAIRRGGASSAGAAARACARHYSAARMAERTLEICAEAQARVRRAA